MSSKTGIAFSELYGRSSGKSKRLAALGAYKNFANVHKKPGSSPIIRILPPTPTKEKDQVQVPSKSSSRIDPEDDGLKAWTRQFQDGNMFTRRRGDVSKVEDKAKEDKEFSVQSISTTAPTSLSKASRTKEVVPKKDQQKVEQKESLSNVNVKNDDQDSEPPRPATQKREFITFDMLLAFGYIWIGFFICLVLIGSTLKETNLNLIREMVWLALPNWLPDDSKFQSSEYKADVRSGKRAET